MAIRRGEAEAEGGFPPLFWEEELAWRKGWDGKEQKEEWNGAECVYWDCFFFSVDLELELGI